MYEIANYCMHQQSQTRILKGESGGERGTISMAQRKGYYYRSINSNNVDF